MTTEDVLARLGVTAATLYIRIKEGRFHPIKKGRLNYFHPHEVDAELARYTEIHRGKTTGRPSKSASAATFPTEKPAIGKGVQTVHLSNSPDYSGEVAAKACELFDDGKTQREVVKELKITFELVEHLYAKWKQLGQEWHLPAKQLLYLREKLSWTENPPTAQGFVAAFERAVTTVAEQMTRDVAKELSKPADKPAVGEELTEAERQALADLEKETGDE